MKSEQVLDEISNKSHPFGQVSGGEDFGAALFRSDYYYGLSKPLGHAADVVQVTAC
jgi:hypothetical protein